MNQDPGAVTFDRGTIRYVSTTFESWQVSIGDIVVVGQYTTAAGPLSEDFFDVLVTKDHAWHELPLGCVGGVGFFGRLGALLSTELRNPLIRSTDLASEVVWPPTLAGSPLFEFRRDPTFWSWATQFFLPQYYPVLSAEVIQYLEQSGGSKLPE